MKVIIYSKIIENIVIVKVVGTRNTLRIAERTLYAFFCIKPSQSYNSEMCEQCKKLHNIEELYEITTKNIIETVKSQDYGVWSTKLLPDHAKRNPQQVLAIFDVPSMPKGQ